MSTYEFSLQFGGKATENGEMEARDIGTAILGLNQSINYSKTILIGDKQRHSLRIKSAVKKNSIDFSFLIELYETAQPLLHGAKDIQVAAMLLFGTWKGAIRLIKWLKGRKYKAIEKNNEILIETEDGEKISVDKDTMKVFENYKFRDGVYKTISKPLESDGIDTAEIKTDNIVEVKIGKDEKDFFIPPTIKEEDVIEEEHSEFLTIISPAFERGYKWKFNDGKSTFHAEIRDEGFLNKVQQRKELFGKGCILLANLLTVQRIEKGQLKKSHTILEVKKHMPPLVQKNLFGDSDD